LVSGAASPAVGTGTCLSKASGIACPE
jgi:hypothetical protein